MIAEKYIKAGIVTGIVLVSLTFVFSVIPFMMNYGSQISWAFTSTESLEKKFKETDEYKIFVERFPNYKEKFVRTYDSAKLTVYAETENLDNVLQLNFYTYMYQGGSDFQINAQCQAIHIKSGNRYSADDFMVASFLEKTNCLEPDPNLEN